MAIHVDHLSKSFRTKVAPAPNFWSSAVYEDRPAVKDMSFDIASGERVAFIGPNGAGKSTTLKMLSGILYPSSGQATVAGFVPWQDRQKLAYHIGLVFGQRSQLWYHLPVRHSFELLGKIYGLSNNTYRHQLELLIQTFDLASLLEQPVKSLSLGQRMRCEIAASLLHAPKILFLDEPTIGLDVTTKAELRLHLRQLSEQHKTTIILTSHDTADIEEVCDRVILINYGEKLIDLSLQAMRQKYLRRKQMVFTVAEETPRVDIANVTVTSREKHKLMVDLDPQQTSTATVTASVLQQLTVTDIVIQDQPLEDIIKQIYHDTRRTA